MAENQIIDLSSIKQASQPLHNDYDTHYGLWNATFLSVLCFLL